MHSTFKLSRGCGGEQVAGRLCVIFVSLNFAPRPFSVQRVPLYDKAKYVSLSLFSFGKGRKVN